MGDTVGNAYTSKPMSLKPHFLDGTPALDVKPIITGSDKELILQNLREKVQINYNYGLGSKGDYPSGDDVFNPNVVGARPFGANGSGLYNKWFTFGENKETPELSFMAVEQTVNPGTINLWG